MFPPLSVYISICITVRPAPANSARRFISCRAGRRRLKRALDILQGQAEQTRFTCRAEQRHVERLGRAGLLQTAAPSTTYTLPACPVKKAIMSRGGIVEPAEGGGHGLYFPEATTTAPPCFR